MCLDSQRPWQEYKPGSRDPEGRRIVLAMGKGLGLVLGTATWIPTGTQGRDRGGVECGL